MKPTAPIALLTTLCLGGSLVFVYALGATSAEASTSTAELDRRLDDLAMTVEGLTARNRELAEIVQALEPRSDRGGMHLTREPAIGIEKAVDLWICENRPDLLPEEGTADAPRPPAENSGGTPGEQAAQLLARLDDPGLDDEGWNEVWKEISAAGLLEEALAHLKERLAQDPDNPDAHLALAGGYFGKSVNTANDMEKGIWAMKADRALDRALELDAWHWEARFTKALSLSMYPPVMGKQTEAMRHFEILRDQQKQLPSSTRYARTYLYLGNLHLQMGNRERASQIWREGLGRYPNSAELAAQLENSTRD